MNLEKGTYGFGRGALRRVAARRRRPSAGGVRDVHQPGPWAVPDAYRKFNGVLRYSRGDSLNGFSLTAMGYHGKWNATEASPERAVAAGLIGRFGSIDPTDGGDTFRYSLAGDWQHSSGTALTRITAYGIAL